VESCGWILARGVSEYRDVFQREKENTKRNTLHSTMGQVRPGGGICKGEGRGPRGKKKKMGDQSHAGIKGAKEKQPTLAKMGKVGVSSWRLQYSGVRRTGMREKRQ